MNVKQKCCEPRRSTDHNERRAALTCSMLSCIEPARKPAISVTGSEATLTIFWESTSVLHLPYLPPGGWPLGKEYLK